MAHILPSGDLLAWCEHGTPLGHSCQFCQLAAPFRPPPDPPPYEPVLDAIRWIEDPWHGPSRPRRPACWLIFWRPCIHQGDG